MQYTAQVSSSPCTTLFITILCFGDDGSRCSRRSWRFEVAFGGSERKQPFPNFDGGCERTPKATLSKQRARQRRAIGARTLQSWSGSIRSEPWNQRDDHVRLLLISDRAAFPDHRTADATLPALSTAAFASSRPPQTRISLAAAIIGSGLGWPMLVAVRHVRSGYVMSKTHPNGDPLIVIDLSRRLRQHQRPLSSSPPASGPTPFAA